MERKLGWHSADSVAMTGVEVFETKKPENVL